MDPVTHTLAGVALGNAFYRDRLGSKAPVALALASNLPDIDALVHLTGSSHAILWRRTFGHSALTIPLWSLGLAWWLRRRYCRHARWGTLYGLCFWGCAVHVLFDWINSFGVVPLWPLCSWRPELAIVFIVDLVLTGTLAAPLILSRLGLSRRLTALSRAALASAAAYLLLCGSARALSLSLLSKEGARLGTRSDFAYAFPEPFGPHRWRGVLRSGGRYRLYLIRPFASSIELRGQAETEPDDERVRLARATAVGRRLDWFFKAPVWTVQALPEGGAWEVAAYDLRFRSLVLDWGLGHGIPFLYRFRVSAAGSVQEL